jgi:hypothetical protein
MSIIGKTIATAIIIATVVNGAVSKQGEEFQPFGRLPGHQRNPDVAIGANGGFVVWQHSTQSTDGERVVIGRLNVLLEGQGSPTRLSGDKMRTNESHPSVALLPNGGAVVAWESGGRNDREVRMRVVNAVGVYQTGVENVNSFTRGNQKAPAVAANAQGEVMVVWESAHQDGDGKGIFARRYTPVGVRLGGIMRVNQSVKWNQTAPSVTALSDGRFIVAWVGEAEQGLTAAGTPKMRGHVMGRLFDRQGNAVGNEFRMDGGQGLCAEPRLAGKAGGGFVLAWTQVDEQLRINGRDVFIREFNKDGLPLALAVKQNQYVQGIQQNGRLANTGNGIIMTWDCGSLDGSSFEVHGRMISGGAEFRVNTRTLYQQRMVTADGDGDGRAMVVWVDVLSSKNTTLKAQNFSTRGGGADLAIGPSVKKGGIGPRRMPLVVKYNEKNASPGKKLEQQREQLRQEAIVRKESAIQEASMVAREAAARSAVETVKNDAIRQSTRQGGGQIKNPLIESNTVEQTRQTLAEKTTGITSNRLSMKPAGEAGAPKTFGLHGGSRRSAIGAVIRGGGRTVARSNLAAQSALRNSAKSYNTTRQSAVNGRGLIGRVPSAFGSRLSLVNRGASQITANRPSSSTQLSAQSAMREYARHRLMTVSPPRFSMRPSYSPTRTQAGVRNMVPRPNGIGQSAQNRALKLQQNATFAQSQIRRTPVAATLNRSSDGRLNLRIQSKAGKRYVVQSSADKVNWRNTGQVQRGTGSPMMLQVRPGQGQRFLRVVPSN